MVIGAADAENGEEKKDKQSLRKGTP